MSSHSTLSVKEVVARGIARRYRNEAIFRALGLGALLIGLGFLAFFFYTLVGNGYTALEQTRIRLDVELDAAVIDPDGDARSRDACAAPTINAWRATPSARLFPEVTSRGELRALYALLSAGAGIELQELVVNEPAAIGETRTLWLLADDDIDVLVKGHAPRDVPEADRRVDDRQLGWLTALEQQGRVDLRFNRYFFTSGASQRSGVGRHLGRDGRLLLHVARDARVVVPARRRDGDLSRGVRAAQPLDRISSRSTSTTSPPCRRSFSACSASRCSSTCSACRARLPSSAGSC